MSVVGRWGFGLAMMSLAALLAGCPRSSQSGGGCSKDRDCKGTRVCHSGSCVDPVPGSAGTRVPALPRGDGDGGVVSHVVSPGATQTPSVGAMLGGGPRHLGQAPGPAPVGEPNLVWEVKVGGPIAATPLAASDGTIYFGSFDKHVYAVSKDGKQLWKFATGDRVWSTPALSSDGLTLYVGSDDDFLYALDAKSGAKKWALQIGACLPTTGKGPAAVKCDVDAGPTLGGDGTIYVGGDAIYAISPEGQLRWKAVTGDHVSSPPALSPDGATLYAGSQDDVIYAVDTATGVTRWTVRTQGQVEPAPVVADDGTIYVGSDDDKLYVIKPTGEIAWSLVTGGDLRRAGCLGPDATYYFGSHDKRVYAVRPDGIVAWTFTTAGRVHSSPTVAADGVVLFGSQDDRVYAVSSAGVLLWFIDVEEDVDSQPWLTLDGTLLVASDAGKLQAYR